MHVASPILILHIGLLKRFPYKMAGTQVPCVPPTAVHLLTWTFMICHAAMRTLAFCSPAIYFPSFGRHGFPHSSLYRSLILLHLTLLSLGMTGAKPLSSKSRPPQIFMAPRNPNKFQNGTAHGPKWKLGRAGHVLWRSEWAKCKMLKRDNSSNLPRTAQISYKMTIEIKKGIPYTMNGPNPAKFSNCILKLLYDSDFMRN